uniref:Uncharacterized protein n=1 Tax=Wuchereria bancrofti TaxID=6293 RepID=A0AAF5PP58_WUCBA
MKFPLTSFGRNFPSLSTGKPNILVGIGDPSLSTSTPSSFVGKELSVGNNLTSKPIAGYIKLPSLSLGNGSPRLLVGTPAAFTGTIFPSGPIILLSAVIGIGSASKPPAGNITIPLLSLGKGRPLLSTGTPSSLVGIGRPAGSTTLPSLS